MNGTARTADKPKRLVVVEPRDEPAERTPAGAPLSPWKTVSVYVEGAEIVVPEWDRGALLDLVQTAYLLDGWDGVDDMGQQIEWTRKALQDPMALARELAPPGLWRPVPQLRADDPLSPSALRAAPPLLKLNPLAPTDPLAWSLVRNYRQGLNENDLPLVLRVQSMYAWARSIQHGLVDDALNRIETKAREIIDARLDRDATRCEQEAIRFFPQISDPGDAQVAFLILEPVTPLPPTSGPKLEAMNDLRERVRELAPAARRVISAERELPLRKLQRMEFEKQVNPDAFPARRKRLDENVQEAQRELEAARSDLALVVGQFLASHPVLYRFRGHELVDVDEGDATLEELVFAKLKRTWLGATRVRSRLSAAGIKARGLGGASEKDRPERRLAEKAIGSSWDYPKLIDEALKGLQADLDSLDATAANEALVAIEERRSREAVAETGLAFTEAVVTVAVHAVAPPLGFALDLALSVRDVWRASDDYGSANDDYHCTLDPAESLAQEPSLLPLTIAVAGSALGVAV